MKKINLLGIEVKRHNQREESFINILKRDVKNFYSVFKNKPHSIDDAYNNLFGKITALYYLELISFEDYEKMTDRFFQIYKFTEEKAKNHK